MNSKDMFAGYSEQQIFDYLYNNSLRNGALICLGRLLERAADMFPDNTALIFKDEHISYKELYSKAALFSKVLFQSGIRPRDRVILLFENSVEFYVGYWAIAQIGAVVIPLNSFLHEKEFAYIITNAQPRALVTTNEFIEQLSTVEDLSLPQLFTPADMAQTSNSDTEQPVPFFDLDPDEMAVLLYTSGTTGFPKGVMLSSRNCMTNVFQVIARAGMGMDPCERILAVLPLFHSFAQNTCVWSTVFTGTTVILVAKIERHLILQGLEHKPTIFLGVPALYGFLCLLKTAPLASIKYFISGGDALPDKIRTAFALIYRRKICSGYGLTETSPVISIELNDEMYPSNTVGRLMVGIEAIIKDEDGTQLKPGSIGELFVKGDNVMLGYYDASETTKEVLHDGWLATGDLAYFDQKKRLVIVGRAKDLIIHKGFNIYPQEIENVLLSHPLVMRAAVIGKEESSVGEVPIAFVQLKEEEPAIESQLKELCEKNLASYKIPRNYIYTTKDLPTTATGKVDKKKLRAELKREE